MPLRFLLLIGLCLAACKSSEAEKPEPEDTSAVEQIPALPRSAELPKGKLLRTSREANFEAMRADLVEADLVYVNLAPELQDGDLLPRTMLDQLFGFGRLHGIALDIFDRTHQDALDEYSFARISLSELLAQTGVTPGAYRSVLEFAGGKRLPLIALDLEPRIVAALKESGFAGLTEEERRSISPATLRNPGFTEAVRRHLKRLRAGGGDEQEFQRELLAADLRYETMADALVRWFRSAPKDAQVVVVADVFAIADRHALPNRVKRRAGKDAVVVVQIAESEIEGRIHDRAHADYVWILPGKGE